MWKIHRTLAVAGVAVVAGLGVGALAAPAGAAQEPVLTEEQQAALQAEIDAYRACLESQGVTLPEKPADGSPPERPEITEEQKEAMRAAREACADSRPSRPELTEEQRATLQAQHEEFRACMDEQLSASGVTLPERPEKPADGSRPERPELSEEQRAAIQAARAACEDVRPNLGVEGLPFGHRHGSPGRFGPGGSDVEPPPAENTAI